VKVVLRSIVTLTSAVALSIFVYVCLCGALLIWHASYNDTRSAGAIVVMGAAQYDGTPSPLLESRLRQAFDDWEKGRATVIAVTGGKRDGDRFSEAEVSQDWLIQRGVPASDIVAENSGASTWESLKGIAPLLQQRGVESVVAVSSPWHVERVMLSLQQLGFDTVPSPTTTSSDGFAGLAWMNNGSSLIKAARETLGVSLGRIIGFDRLLSITG
jgi:uncharacterized SAM-binding protein YcdF (DUF218 family)